MGSASSRMSASPALIQPTVTANTASSSPSSRKPAPQDHYSPLRQYGQPANLSAAARAARANLESADPKGKGKQRQPEREEGEISEEDETTLPKDRIRGVDSWKPRTSSTFRAPDGVSPSRRADATDLNRPAPSLRHNVQVRDRRSSTGPGSDPMHLRTSSPPSTAHRRESNLSTGTASTSNSDSPSSDSLALPSGVNSDEAEQYMDIIRNLILSGISPEALIKRGAARQYITAACERILEETQRRSAIGTDIRVQDIADETPQADEPLAGPSQPPTTLLRSSLGDVDMERDVSSTSHGSHEPSDEVDRILSPPRTQRLVPSSSWAPVRSNDATSRSAPRIRTESYRPVMQSAPARAQSESAQAKSALDPSASAFTPHVQMVLDPTATRAGGNTTVSPVPMSETLAERKKRVLESMKRGRQVKPLPSAPSASKISSQTVAQEPAPIQPILAPTPQLASKATLQDEVAALEREVMQLQENRPPVQTEPEEGEIVTSNTPSPALTPIALPSQPQPKSTAVLGGPRLNRATKRPRAEDLVDGRATSAKPTYPIKRKFGRPVGWSKLQVSLDDSEDEDQPEPPTAVTIEPFDTERAKLEEDIRLLKEQIEKRRLARAQVKTAKVSSETPPPQQDIKVEPVQQVDIVTKETWRPEMTAARTSSTANATRSPVDIDMTAAEIVTPLPHSAQAESEKVASDAGSPVSETLIMTPATSLDTPASSFSFREYHSLLRRYPLLPTPNSLQSSLSRFDLPHSTTSLIQLDQQLLSSIILTRALKRNPNAVICPAEAAGGICANPSCSDLHLAKLLGRPDEVALVEYLVHVTQGRQSRGDLTAALGRAKKSLGISSDTVSLQVAEQLVIKVGQLLSSNIK